MVKSIIKKHKDSKVSKKEESKKPSKKVEVKPVHKVKVVERAKTHSKPKIQKTKIIEKIPKKKDKGSEIHSLKEMEEKILEKFEEQSPELKQTEDNVAEEVIKVPIEEIVELEKTPEHKEVHQKSEVKSKPVKIKSDEDNDYKSRVEAILFAVGKYLDDEMISQLCDIDKRNTKKALEELKKDYDARDGALMIVQEDNSWKINVREKYLSIVRKVVTDTELSKSIMETLAVIAWKTPVYQNEVVRIRGNKCYDHIEALVDAGFVTKDKKGRSYVLKTTEKFYNYFDIDHKNLRGVMSEAKMPVEQKTLDEIDKPQEVTYSREKLLQTLETIETKSIIHTEEDKLSQKEFLEQIHKKIDEASKRTDEVVSDIPRPMHETEHVEMTQPNIEDISPPLHGDAVVEKEEDIVINTDVPNGVEHHFQKPEDQPQKPKQLTKKQLEKKFRDELQRVKEKSEQKK